MLPNERSPAPDVKRLLAYISAAADNRERQKIWTRAVANAKPRGRKIGQRISRMIILLALTVATASANSMNDLATHYNHTSQRDHYLQCHEYGRLSTDVL